MASGCRYPSDLVMPALFSSLPAELSFKKVEIGDLPLYRKDGDDRVLGKIPFISPYGANADPGSKRKQQLGARPMPTGARCSRPA